MRREKLVILGGTGSGIIVADAATVSTRAFDVIGFLNDGVPRGSDFSGIPVLGNFAAWQDCPAEARFISAFPKAKEAFARFARLVSLGIPDDRWATVIHPAAHVAPDARLGPGSFVGAAAVVEPGLEAELALAGWRPIGTTHYQFILYPVVWMLRSLLPVSAEQIRPSRLLNRMLAAANELEVS